MLKSLILIAVFVVLAPCVFADFAVVYPFEQKISGGSTVDIGEVSSGETFEIIVSDESFLGQDARWESVFVGSDGLPTGWVVENPLPMEKRLSLKISVPPSALQNTYSVKVTGLNSVVGLREEFTARVRVRENLLHVAVDSPGLNQFPFTGEKVVYNLVVRNDSIAPHSVKVFSDLPKNWFDEVFVEVPPKETKKIVFGVVPQFEGKKDFEINVFSVQKQKVVLGFDFSLGVKPTLFGKFSSPKNGFAFFSFSLLPFYFFDSFVFSFFD